MSATLIELSFRAAMALLIVNGVLGVGGVLTWVERKQSALMQNRIGANRASILGFRVIGLFHMMTDGLKMLVKEDFVPPRADKLLHTLAPILAIGFAILVFVAIPIGDRIAIGEHVFDLRVADINLGILAIFALLGMIVYGVMLGGLCSSNNFALIGALRAAAQMVSYEIIMGLSVLGIVIVYGTLDLQEICRLQGERTLFGALPMWGVFVQPFGFLLFTTAIIAESKRVPFDLPEAESEIIGYFTEYSGMRFGLFLFSDFVESLIGACLVTILFFGGWQIPFVVPPETPTLLWTFASVASLGAKVIVLTWLFMTIRWTLPRFRYDQLMNLCWKIMLPVALINLAVTAVWVVIATGGLR